MTLWKPVSSCPAPDFQLIADSKPSQDVLQEAHSVAFTSVSHLERYLTVSCSQTRLRPSCHVDFPILPSAFVIELLLPPTRCLLEIIIAGCSAISRVSITAALRAGLGKVYLFMDAFPTCLTTPGFPRFWALLAMHCIYGVLAALSITLLPYKGLSHGREFLLCNSPLRPCSAR